MIAEIETRPLVVHQVTPWQFLGPRPPAWCELRSVTLRITTCLLGATAADLDIVSDARSLADLAHCPACGPRRAG